jgi:ribosomal-protein-alanine N-acetyltransferase
MFTFTILKPEINDIPEKDLTDVVDFLYNHLDQFGDPKSDIMNCVKYALNPEPGFGGFILTAKDNKNGEIVGTVIMNRTGMKGYIPDNLLVYIAVHGGYRGKGLGKKLMNLALETADGDIALHVEPDNPARYLYEKLGFTNKYLEMRLKR